MVAFDTSAAFVVKASVQNFDEGVFVIDLCLIIVNVFGILVVIVFQQKFALYAGLPQDMSDLPSFGPEVSPCYEIICAMMYPKPFAHYLDSQR